MQQTIELPKDNSCLEQRLLVHQNICGEETLRLLSSKYSRYIVETYNPCPCYLETLLELNPWALLGSWDAVRPQASELVASGERYFSAPEQKSVLTRAERQVLRLIAVGFETKVIAQRLGKEPSTVSFQTRAIYSKLRAAYPNFTLENHVHLTHFWRGQWQLLEGLYTQ